MTCLTTKNHYKKSQVFNERRTECDIDYNLLIDLWANMEFIDSLSVIIFMINLYIPIQMLAGMVST